MIRLRETRPSDLPSLGELFEGRFGRPLSPEEWHWKYLRLPGEARSRVAVDGTGRVLAHAGTLGLPARREAGEGPVEPAPAIWQLVDWAGTVSGAGLRPPLVDLGRALLADLPRPTDAPWIFGFPSERHFRLGERVFGYRPLSAIMPLAGPLAGAGGGPGEACPDEPWIEVSDRCGDWGEAAWQACHVPSVRRSVAFLNWRYHARPGPYYRFYRVRPASAAGGVDGLAVFAFVERLARGAELWLPSGSDGAAPAARPEERWGPGLRAVARDLAAAGLERWELWPPPAAARLGPLLHELGLRPEGPAVFMGCRGRQGDRRGPSPADAGFHYSMGDYDLV